MKDDTDNCECNSVEEHERMIARIDESFRQDSERRRNAPTSETLRKRRAIALNGNGGIHT